MKKILLGLALILILSLYSSNAQEQPSTPQQQQSEPFSRFNLGAGLGIGYGGMGLRLTGLPSKRVGIFAAGGYNFDKIAFNGGVSLRLLPDRRACPKISAMYGYNSVIVYTNAMEHNKTFYGPSFSFELELRGKRSQNFFSFGFVVPFPPQKFWDEVNSLDSQGADFKKPWPVALSLGYHFAF